ncbi:MAG: DNA polymerase III subunit gamma/tau [Calditrichaeota bacterium]|nr:MAG: DNA polymerase III subunit gamma/tau [Calditrichota bacterium]
MTYIVLARKWRPMTFESVVGQEHVTRTLMNSLTQQRIAHAYIFAGPRGVGKTTTARLLAKAVNCERQPAVNPCNECAHCQQATRGQSLDIIEIDGASNRGIDEIRNLRENIRFAPVAARYKVYIIDEVHMLSKEAFNALLKTLEEPPAHAIFIFATTEIHRVPLTILSRCQRFDFKRIPTAQITDQLKSIAEKENISAEEDALLLIARKSEGSMRDAISIFDQMISFSEGNLTLKLVQESLGVITEEVYFELTDLMQQKDEAGVIHFARKVYQDGHDLMHFLQGLEEHFRNLLLTLSTGNTRLLETSDYIKQLYQEKAAHFSEKDLLHYLDILVQHESLLKYSENPQLILELLLLKLLHKPLSVDLEELLRLFKERSIELPESSSDEVKSESAQKGRSTYPTNPGSASTGSKTTSTTYSTPQKTDTTPKTSTRQKFDSLKESPLPTSSPGKEDKTTSPEEEGGEEIQLDISRIQENWEQFLENVKKEKIVLASFLQEGIPLKLEKNILQVAFDPKNAFHISHIQQNSRYIESLLKELFGVGLRLQCVEVDFEKSGIQKQSQSPEEIFENIKQQEPVLKKLIDLFDCENLDPED